METIPLITRANKWTGFYMIETSVKKELNKGNVSIILKREVWEMVIEKSKQFH